MFYYSFNSRPVQPLLRACLGLAASVVYGEIGDVPVGNELAQRSNSRMLGELAQGVDGDEISRPQRRLNALVLFVRRLAAGGLAVAFPVLKETKRPSSYASSPLKPFFDNNRPLSMLVYRQMVSY